MFCNVITVSIFDYFVNINYLYIMFIEEVIDRSFISCITLMINLVIFIIYLHNF